MPVLHAAPITDLLWGMDSTGSTEVNGVRGQWAEEFSITVDVATKKLSATWLTGFPETVPKSTMTTGKGIDAFDNLSIVDYSLQTSSRVWQSDTKGKNAKVLFNAEGILTKAGNAKAAALFGSGIADITGTSSDLWINPFAPPAGGGGLAFEFKDDPKLGWTVVNKDGIALSKAGPQFDGMEVFDNNGKIIANEGDAAYTLGNKNNCPKPNGPTEPRGSVYDIYDATKGGNPTTPGFIKTDFPASGIAFDAANNLFFVSDICRDMIAVYQSNAALTMSTFIGEVTLPADGNVPKGQSLCSVKPLTRCIEDLSIFQSAPAPAPLIGRGLLVFLAVGGILLGAFLSRRRAYGCCWLGWSCLPQRGARSASANSWPGRWPRSRRGGVA
jgi:hypothetical protein